MGNDLALGSVGVVSMSILGCMVHQNSLFSAKMRNSFLRAILAIAVVILAEMGTSYFGVPGTAYRLLNVSFCILGFGLSPFVPNLIAMAFDDNWGSKWSALAFLPAVINIVLTVLSPIYGFIFFVSPDNSYCRGPYFFVFIISYLLSMVFLLMKTLHVISVYQNKTKLVLFWILFLVLAGSTMQILWPSVRSAWISVTLAMVMYYAYYNELLEKHDAVTNLFNRQAYEYHLQRLEARGHGAVILFDVDDFKQKNDEYGHPYGDACLKKVAAGIRVSCAKIGLCHRIGGDEFCVLSESTDEKVIRDAETLFLKNMNVLRKQDPKIPLVSFGHAIYDKSREGIEQVVAEADRQLYRYKRRRKLEGRQPAESCDGEVYQSESKTRE